MTQMLEQVTTSYAQACMAQKSWFVHAGNTLEALNRIDLIGPQDSLIEITSTKQVLSLSKGAPSTVDAHTYWFVDGIGGKGFRVADIRAIGEAAREQGAILIVDNTVASFYGCNPISMGAHIVLEALDRVGQGKLFQKTVAVAVAPSVHGTGRKRVVDSLAEDAAQMLERSFMQAEDELITFNPDELSILSEGLESTAKRMQTHMDHARALAEYLSCSEGPFSVSYPGLEMHPDHEIATRVLKHGFGPAIDIEFNRHAETTAGQFIESCPCNGRTYPAGGPHTRLSAPDGDGGKLVRIFAGLDNPLEVAAALDPLFQSIAY